MSISLQFLIDGKEYIAPKGWKGLKEKLIFGKGTTEATIEAEKLTFYGDAMLYIKNKVDKGHILRPIDFEAILNQNGENTTFFQNYIIDLTKGVEYEFPKFGALDVPLAINCSIRRKLGFDSFIQEVQGVSFGYMLEEGYVTSSNYTEVKLTVIEPNNGKTIALALLSLMIITLQINQLIDQVKELIVDIQQRFTSALSSGPSTAIYTVVTLALRAASIIVLSATIIKAMNDIIKLIILPIIKDNGMTWRSLVQGVVNAYNSSKNDYNILLDCDLDEFDTEVLYPSRPHTNSLKLTEKVKESVFPYYADNKVGIPNSKDSWYLAGGLFELIKLRFNAVFYFDGNKLTIKNKGDNSLYQNNGFKPSISPLLSSGEYNITEIPQTTLYSFQTDPNDAWTTENYRGTSYEVKCNSKYTRLTGLKTIDLPIALGSTKDKINFLEKIVKKLAKAGDVIGSIGGGQSNLESKFTKKRVNILKVSQRDISVGKLLPISGGNMPKVPTDTTSAKAIENKYYVIDSIKRGDGQKIKHSNVKFPFVLQDRNNIRNNSQFIDSNGNKATFESIDWSFAKDDAITNYYVNYKYIADDDIDEIFIEPD